MEKLQLQATLRDSKFNLKKLREQGLVPAVLYGRGVETTSLSINSNEFERILRKAGESTIVELMVEGKAHPVLIHEIQNHYLTSRPQHVDFYQVSMTEKLKAKVALEFVGESIAVKNLGGVLVKILNEVEVECLPIDLPRSIAVNLEPIKTLQDAIYVKDLPVPPKVKILTNLDELAVKVQPPRDVEAELATPVVEDVSKVEGAAEDKPVEAGAEGGEAKEAKETKKEETA